MQLYTVTGHSYIQLQVYTATGHSYKQLQSYTVTSHTGVYSYKPYRYTILPKVFARLPSHAYERE